MNKENGQEFVVSRTDGSYLLEHRQSDRAGHMQWRILDRFCEVPLAWSRRFATGRSIHDSPR